MSPGTPRRSSRRVSNWCKISSVLRFMVGAVLLIPAVVLATVGILLFHIAWRILDDHDGEH